MQKETEIKKVKLSDIKTQNDPYDYGKFYYFIHGRRMKNLEESINKFGYSPKQFKSWITVTQWNKNLFGLKYKPFDKYYVWDGNHRMSILNKLYPPETEIEVKVKKSIGLTFMIILGIVIILSIVGLWFVFTNWWVLLVLMLLSVGINYTKAKSGENFFDVVGSYLKNIKNKFLKR